MSRVQTEVKQLITGMPLVEQLAFSEHVLKEFKGAVRDGQLELMPAAMHRLQNQINETRKVLGLRT